jgi:hypothetical protein
MYVRAWRSEVKWRMVFALHDCFVDGLLTVNAMP